MENITLTKLYAILAQKIGRNEAESLTQYIEVKIKDEVRTKVEILATKEDLHELRGEMRESIHGVRGEIHGLRVEMKDSALTLQKWMLSIFITLVIMILGLYAAIFLKH